MEKKTNLTNSIYQSKFLPIIQKAETEIKKLIQFYALRLKSKFELRQKIHGIIMGVAKHLPFSLYDRDKYLYGLHDTSEKMIKEFYDSVIAQYFLVVSLLILAGVRKKPSNPLELLDFERKSPEIVKNVIKQSPRNMWSEAKGTPYVSDYGTLVKRRQKELAKTVTVSFDKTKHPISLWQKAEIDIRYENQMNMLNGMIDDGVQLAWLSSHPDCSKRCEKWQGELVSLTESAGGGQTQNSPKSAFYLRTVDGHKVYSLVDITQVTDKYGYYNNIIVGFNCRHHLIPYTGQAAPKDYDSNDIKRERAINAKLREFERKIRFNKQMAILYNKTSPELANQHRKIAEKLTAKYKKFAEENGFAWYEYRITV